MHPNLNSRVQLIDLIKNFIQFGIGRAGTQVVAFLLLPIYTRHISVVSFAKIELITVCSNFILTVVGLNITSGIARYYYDYKHTEEVKIRNSTALIFSIFMCIISIIILHTFRNFFFKLFQLGSISEFYYCLLLFPVSFLNQFQLFIFQVRKEAKQFSIVNIISIITISALSIYYVVVLKEGLDGYMKGRIFGLTIVTLLGLLFQYKEFLAIPSYKELRKLLSFSLPSLPGQIFQKFKVLFERQIILLFIGATILGNYSITLKLLLPISLIIESFRLSWVGFVSSTTTQKNNKELYAKTFSGFALFTTLFSIPLILYSKEAILFFAGKQFELAYQPFSWLLLNSLLTSYIPILNVGLGITEKMKYMSYGTIISSSISIGLYYLLTPYFQIWGLLFAQTAGILIFILITFNYSNKLFKVSFDFTHGLKMFSVFLTISITNQWINSSTLSLYLVQTLKIMIMLVTLAILLIAYKKEFKTLRRKIINL